MRRLFYLIVVLQLLFLIGRVVTSETPLLRGRIVTLKTAPVDPRSLMMGNYIALSYEISTIDTQSTWVSGQREGGTLHPGDTVYVRLRPGRPWAEPVDVSVGRLLLDAPELVSLRGRVIDVDGKKARIDYGLERYYIPENKEAAVEKLQWPSGGKPATVTVEAAVTGNGQGRIHRVLVDGKPLEF